MSLRLAVVFDHGCVYFPPGHLSRIGGTVDGAVTTDVIADADLTATPPEIRTVSGVTLFVSAEQREELEWFCRASRIPTRTRPDVWGDLLEPFLDTQFTPEHEAATLSRLRRAGMTETEVGQIRARVGPLMLAYNAIHWDWSHLGLADLLDAMTTEALPGGAELGETSSFYRWAMGIANSQLL